MKIIRIKDCSECEHHKTYHVAGYTYCYKSKMILLRDYPTIPDWCEFEEVKEGKERPIRWNILWNRFVKRFKGASVSEEEVFLWLKNNLSLNQQERRRNHELRY